MITIISALDKNSLIGNGNKLPWNYPEDMKWFREQTLGSIIIMGRKTYESIPKLDRRICYVLSKDITFNPEHCIVLRDKKEVLDKAKLYKMLHNLDTYIIGGAQIYKEFLDVADRLLITHIDKKFKGNIYFPLDNFDNYDKNIIKKSGDLTFIEYKKVIK